MGENCDIGLVGLAVMGQNLVLNMVDHGFRVAVFNRTYRRVEAFISGPAKGKAVEGCPRPEDMARRLKRPRRVMLMVKAGEPVDATISQFAPLLDPGDILVDGGNSFFEDTERRLKALKKRGVLYVGSGISGGEEGARHGPSIMPGGEFDAWPHVRPILQAVAAKVDLDGATPCCDWVGPGGSGHYVKMIHNGIEYGDMQLICEAYSLLKEGLGLSNEMLYDVFDHWNRSELDSYLIEITRDIFSVIDPQTGDYLLDRILDRAGQKGTGKWTAQSALDLGTPTTLIAEAVFARGLSAMKEQRTAASRVLDGPGADPAALRASADGDRFVEAVRRALYVSKICSYAQGFSQLQAAAEAKDWKLDCGAIAMLWRGGCIIRAAFLEKIKEAYDRAPELQNLLLDPYFKRAVAHGQSAWREVVASAVRLGIPVPAMASGLAYYDGYRRERLPHNLLQAQRDYFGAHMYERIDRGGRFHTDWLKARRPPKETGDGQGTIDDGR